MEMLLPLWALPNKLNRLYNYFINLKLERFPIIVIFHLVDKEPPYRSYLNDVIVSLLLTVKCKSNYRCCLFAIYMNYKGNNNLPIPWSFNSCNHHFDKRKAKQNVEHKN